MYFERKRYSKNKKISLQIKIYVIYIRVTMSSQIFKSPVNKQILFDLLDKVCLKTDKYYLFDANAYRKMVFNKYNESFYEWIKPHYHVGKKFYVERDVTYNAFTSILRQICKYHAIMHVKKIRYNESSYNIHYMIYF